MKEHSKRYSWRVAVALVLVALLVVPLSPAGTAGATGPKEGVTIHRDAYSVPHVYADTVYDLFFGFGYVVAQDRLFQLEMFRRTTEGTVSEVLGSKYVNFDKQTRITNYPLSEVQKRVNALAPEYQEILKGYTDGINACVDEVLADPAKLPFEFKQLGFQPPRWTVADVGAIFVGTMATRYNDFSGELGNAALLKYLVDTFGGEQGKSMFNDLWWIEDPKAPTTVPRKARTAVALADQQTLPGGITEVAAQALAQHEQYVADLRSLGMPAAAGSNAWLIGPKKSASGNSMLFGGPQMGWFTPSYLHEVGLHGAGFEMVGSTTVGYPIVLFGYNENIAWTTTAGVGNVVDIFAEALNPANPEQYLYKGKWMTMEKRTETIKVKDGDSVSFDVYRTIHGPVISVDTANNKAYAKKRSWEGAELESWAAWLDSTRANNWDEWLTASRRSDLTISSYFADRKGNIGYAYMGKYPIRAAGIDPRLPTPGTGEYEWLGFIPKDKNPFVLNPPEGYIANWNNQPAEGWSNPDFMLWGNADRVRVIRDAIEARGKISFDDMKEINRHVSYADVNAQYLKPFLIKSARQMSFVDARLAQAARLLEEWNNSRVDKDLDGFYDSPGQAIFETWVSTILDYAFKVKLGPMYGRFSYKYPVGPMPSSMNVPSGVKVLEHIFAGANSSLPTSIDYFNGWPLHEATADALIASLNKLQSEQGDDMSRWRSRVTVLKFDTINFAGIPQGMATPVEIVYQNRGSENHLVELGSDGIRAENVVPPGQSGFLSTERIPIAHFDTQTDLFVKFGYKKMPLRYQPQ
mgnify:CR=1 FL=1